MSYVHPLRFCHTLLAQSFAEKAHVENGSDMGMNEGNHGEGCLMLIFNLVG